MKTISFILTFFMVSMTISAQNMEHSSMKSTDSKEMAKIMSSPNYLKLNQDMRKLWSDHMHWTLATVDAFYNEPKQLDVKLNRLLENQKQIGAAIVPYYGKEAGDKLAKLLKEHIEGSVPVLKAAKANDKVALEKALMAWHKNAKEIADFLSAANPKNWPTSATEPMMKSHIDQTTEYSVHILKGEFKASVDGFEEALQHMLMLADTLSEGIAKQFPDKF